jgi:hypothetical protein
MSRPFFIWTMRRTGGTSLTDLLMELSEHRKMQHEPFLADRQLGMITRRFFQKGGASVRKPLEEVFAQGSLIKHCYEILGRDFNDTILDVLTEFREYRHIFLLRRDETARMLSLMLALQTDVWGKHGSEKVYEAIRQGTHALQPFDLKRMREEEAAAIRETGHIKELLTQKGIEYTTVYFEELYVGERQQRMKRVRNLLKFLEFGPEVFQEKRDRIRHTLFHRSQKSRSVMEYVPNLQEAIEILESFPGREVVTGGTGSDGKIKSEEKGRL